MKKILIVDDDPILRRVLQNSLEQKGYQVISVGSGSEALTQFERDIPDLVVSDVSMPEMNGFEFCRQLRSQPSGKLIPFIFLSAMDEVNDRIQGHTIGADSYLTKPFEMKELLANIDALIERSRRVHAEIVHLIEQLANSQSTPRSRLEARRGNSAIPQAYNANRSCLEMARKPRPLSRSKFVTHNNNGATSDSEPKPLPLTPAEERVFWETIQGYTNKQISERLFISPRTVQTHLSNILNKLDLSNRTQLVRFAYEQGYEKV